MTFRKEPCSAEALGELLTEVPHVCHGMRLMAQIRRSKRLLLHWWRRGIEERTGDAAYECAASHIAQLERDNADMRRSLVEVREVATRNATDAQHLRQSAIELERSLADARAREAELREALEVANRRSTDHWRDILERCEALETRLRDASTGRADAGRKGKATSGRS